MLHKSMMTTTTMLLMVMMIMGKRLPMLLRTSRCDASVVAVLTFKKAAQTTEERTEWEEGEEKQ